MTTQRPLQDSGPGSDTDPTGEVRTTYEPTVVDYGLSGFTEGLKDRPWEEAHPTYRADFERRQGSSTRRWEEAEPAYRYSHEMRSDPRFADRRWSEAEPELRVYYVTWRRERGYGDEDDWDTSAEDAREVWQRLGGG